jgi:(p)ppGpp synthase/HD superfamily hydrolase
MTPGWNQDLFKRALDFAARAHGEQKVPGSGFPYVVHVTKVATEVLAAAAGFSDDERDLAMVCALLHDTIEDAGISEDAIATEFGAAVATGVRALTKNESLPKAERMADSLARIREQPRAIWSVKLADRITNLEPPPPNWSIEKRRHYVEEARAILDALRGANLLLEDRLAQQIATYASEHCR